MHAISKSTNVKARIYANISVKGKGKVGVRSKAEEKVKKAKRGKLKKQ